VSKKTVSAAAATTAVIVSLVLSACGGGNGLDGTDLGISPYPNRRGQEVLGQKNFAYLMNNHRKAKLAKTPWVGWWWAYTANGVANGLHHPEMHSPAGKYDAARGGFPKAQEWEIANHGATVPGVQGWWGHCNGWCVASTLFPEPREPVTVNGIEFSVADQKALLTEAGMESSSDFFGSRVDDVNQMRTPRVEDVVPAQFFLILTNYLGKKGLPVLMDRHTTYEVWNQPIAGYSFEYPKPSDYLGEDPAHRGLYRVNLTTTIWWAEDGVPPGELTGEFDYQDNRHFSKRTLKMELWLDGPIVFDGEQMRSSGDVVVTRQGEYFVGGAWKNGAYSATSHPDFMWIPYSLLKPTTYANPEIDIEWVKKHVMGHQDDPSAVAVPVVPAPSPTPSIAPSPEPTTGITPRPPLI